MPSNTRVARWGNNLAVRIPQAIVREARLAEGDRLSIDLTADGSIVLRSQHRKYSLDQLVASIRPGSGHHETDWGTPKRKELSLYSLRRAVAGSRRRARCSGG